VALPVGAHGGCLSCRYFREHDSATGACHRFPPVFGGEMPRDVHRWKFPLVGPHAWCGEYRPVATVPANDARAD
jgi:hypothetical protein